MRLLRRRLRFAVVLLLCLSLSVDPASACQWLMGRWMNRCAPSPTYCMPVAPPCYPTGYAAAGCCGESWASSHGVVSSDCGCGEVVVHSGETIYESGPVEARGGNTPPSVPTPTWAGPEPSTDRAVNKPNESEPLPSGDAPPALSDDDSPGDIPPPPPQTEFGPADDELFAEPREESTDLGPAPLDEPAPIEDDLFAEPTAEPPVEEPAVDEPVVEEPVMEEPAVDATEDDLFGAPAAEQPEDDLFGAPPTEPATEEPADAEDDLFGAPAADEPAEEPAAEEDLFGAPGDAAATEEPATEDDLFGAPAEEPAADAPAEDDLFGAPADAPATQPPAEDDLFGAPAAEPAAEEPDDLFGAPAEEAAPADEAADAPAEEEDDLFGDFGAILDQPGGLSSLALRHWVDSTGNYTVDARLIAVVDGHVRLLKANGRTATVALGRLSDEDVAFVNRQAAAQHAKTLVQTAQR